MEVSGDAIAEIVLKQYDALPAKRKPQVRGDGVREWVPLSGIVAKGKNGLQCLSLATGMKCLPQSKIPMAQGIVLHDWHAEILAIRSFNRFLLEECYELARSGKKESHFLRQRNVGEMSPELFQPFALNDDIQLYMYCSEAPCGDASMELTMAAQDDATPWEISSIPSSKMMPGTVAEQISSTPLETVRQTSNSEQIPTANTSLVTQQLLGRGYFSELGIVRRKPARPDAPSTLSKSCSDKLALKQCTTLLSALTSLLLSPTPNCHVRALVLPTRQYSASACERAFGPKGRMGALLRSDLGSGAETAGASYGMAKSWPGGYSYQPFQILTTSHEFRYSRRGLGPEPSMTRKIVTNKTEGVPGTGPSAGPVPITPNIKFQSSNVAASWIANGAQETLIGGVLQGRKPFDPRGASRVCKKSMWKLAFDVAGLAAVPTIEAALRAPSYGAAKDTNLLAWRRAVGHEVKSVALQGWVPNKGGESFEP